MKKKKIISFMITFVKTTTDAEVSIGQEEHVQEGNLSSAYIFRIVSLYNNSTNFLVVD